MLSSQNKFGYALTFALILSASVGQYKALPIDCNLTRCNPYYMDLVWSIVDEVCMVFNNGCMFGRAVCARQNEGLSPITATDKDSCQEYCANCIGVPKAVVCGIFSNLASDGTNADKRKNFKNKCELDRYACKKGKAYSYYADGICQL